MANRIAREVAEASRTKSGRKIKVSHADTLVDCARTLERLMAKRRKLRRELKSVTGDITHVKKEMRAMIAQVSGKGEL